MGQANYPAVIATLIAICLVSLFIAYGIPALARKSRRDREDSDERDD